MVVHGLAGYDQSLGDLRVAHPLRDEREHLELARGQAGGIAARRRPGALAQVPYSALAQRARDPRRRRARAEPLQLGEAPAQRCLLSAAASASAALVRAAESLARASTPPRAPGQLEPERLGDRRQASCSSIPAWRRQG